MKHFLITKYDTEQCYYTLRILPTHIDISLWVTEGFVAIRLREFQNNDTILTLAKFQVQNAGYQYFKAEQEHEFLEIILADFALELAKIDPDHSTSNSPKFIKMNLLIDKWDKDLQAIINKEERKSKRTR